MPVLSLVCPGCYTFPACWGHVPGPLLNSDISEHLVKMLILSQPLQVSSHSWYPGCTGRNKKKILKQHCRSNLTDVSCHVFGHQSLSIEKPRKKVKQQKGRKWDDKLSSNQQQSGLHYLSVRWIFIYSAETKRKIQIILSLQRLE